jgi:hypothetical protein
MNNWYLDIKEWLTTPRIIYGGCSGRDLRLVNTGVPPYGHAGICGDYNKLSKYRLINYDECILCESWEGKKYEEFVRFKDPDAKEPAPIVKQFERFTDLDHE